MAFNKRLWKGRQGTGLNKFSINGATPVTVINQPDSVTEQGDALSAGNLNDLEDRIYDAFDDIADGTQIVGKATSDASGNVITSTYATKSELTSEATARANADSNLLSAIDSNSQRIENLEVAVSGSLVQTNTDATMANTKTITNANEILPWAILKRVGARSTQFNQMTKNGDFSDVSGGVVAYWANGSNCSISISNGIATLTPVDGSVSGNRFISNVNNNIIAGHKYVVAITHQNSSPFNLILRKNYDAGNYEGHSVPVSASSMTTSYILFEPTFTGTTCSLQVVFDSIPQIQIANVHMHDITAMNEASLTADEFGVKYPASYYALNAGSIIPLNPSAFKVVGKNKIDESTMSRTNMEGSANVKWIRWTNPIKYISGTYFFKSDGLGTSIYSLQAYIYDGSGNQISNVVKTYFNPQTGTEIVLPDVNGASYFLIGVYHPSDISALTPSNTILCLNSVTDKTYEAYKETTIDTSFTSDYKYVNENCHDYSENVLVDGVMKGKKHKRTGEVTNISLFSHQGNLSGGGLYYADYNSSLIKKYGAAICNLLPFKATGAWESTTPCLQVGGTGRLRIYTTASNQSALESLYADIHIFYGLEEEIVTDADPIPNIPCEDGTTVQAVTPQTDIVNAIDVPSTIAYMTKIGG